MTALDDVFGPGTESATIVTPRRTNWPRAEERIRPILDALEETMGFSPQGQLRASWVAGAREYVDNVGMRADLVRPVAEYMRDHQLTVKSPRSLIAIALQWRETLKSGDAARNRYGDFDTSEED